MNNLSYHCKWRIELGKQICEKLKMIEGIKAVVIGGSVARGFADEYSDLEIILFWDNLPNEKIRKLIVKELNAEYFYPYNYEANEDNVIVNGFRIDIWYLTIKDEEDAIKGVIIDLKTDFSISNAMDTIRTCIPLYGEEIVSYWKLRAKEYPTELAIKNIKESLQSIDITQAEIYIQRQNSTLLYELIVNLHKNLFLILLALNKQYFPTFKWMYKALETFKIIPPVMITIHCGIR